MRGWIIGLAMFAAYLAIMAIWVFVKTYRKPPAVPDLHKVWPDDED